MVPERGDPARPQRTAEFSVEVDGKRVVAKPGQTVAAVLMTIGRTSWHSTRQHGKPRGLFCGIGVCFDCLLVVNEVPDVRACQRVVAPGDVIRTQHGAELGGDS
ncbi:(2Fe-2S)-binding protein [Saccharopolyspora indica]|uniref:(2Fe-2S)-binding protein n=1 Tax=Saccharopolyspora indica TaxID=1229659 RepID=UPI0022EB08CF|nr:(2Fe-2S)-binding protein [Saccharopolyspora indica]MDA3644497.1 (2Fe-2S)-binding protein [Saccharopolyspora indica]